MVNVMSGPSKTEAEAMSCDFEMLQREHCTENGALYLLLVELSPGPTPGESGTGKRQGAVSGNWRSVPRQRWFWKICQGPGSLRAGPASCRVMRRYIKLSSRSR